MKTRWSLAALIISAIAVLVLSGCESFNFGQTREEAPGPPPSSYLDFEDVQIPGGLKLVREQSFVYENNNLRAGVLALKGDGPVVAVLNHFQTRMPADGWEQLSSFKYHKNILIYTKPDKVCLVIVTAPFGDDDVNVEVWVSPSAPGASSPLNMFKSTPGSNTGPREEPLTYPGESS